MVALVRERIGPVASFKTALVVERLPKTRSGKILRGTMRAHRRRRGIQDAGDDRRPGDPDEITASLKAAGLAKEKN